MAQPIIPDNALLEAFPLPKFIPRTRREINTIDSINCRQFEHWQTDAKYDTFNRPDLNIQSPFYDQMPNDSRMNDNSYRSQPRYDPYSTSYFDKYDTSFDPRNMTRELRASVYEDKNTEFLQESERLLQRNFDNRWLNPTVVSEQAKAAEMLRPKMDDIRMYYRNVS